MFRIIFTPAAANQYADIIESLTPYPQKLSIFEKEIEKAISRLEQMPESYAPKGGMRAARLVKSRYYLFYVIEQKEKKVVVTMIVHQHQDPSSWPK